MAPIIAEEHSVHEATCLNYAYIRCEATTITDATWYKASNIAEMFTLGKMSPWHNDCCSEFPVWETKFLEHSPEDRCSSYVLYKIPLAQANFLLAQLKMHSH